MKKTYTLALFALLFFCAAAHAKEARLVRYPHYHEGRVAFSYLGDVWVADEDGRNVQRLTVNRARDVYPRFSPDGKWIAFSSDRNGNLDVYVMPSAGGSVKQLTFHSSEDSVLNWSPDGRSVLFSANRGENFMPMLYTVSVDGGMPVGAGADMGVQGSFSPDGRRLAYNQKAQSYWRKFYRGSYQSDVMVADVAAKKFTNVTDFEGLDSWPMWARDGNIYFVSDRDGGGLTNVWRVPESGGRAERVTSFKSGDVRWPAISADGKTIVFEHDYGVSKLDVASKRVTPLRFDINAETEESLTEVRNFNSEVDNYDLAPNSRRIAFAVHGEVFTAPVEEGDLRQITDSPWRDRNVTYSPDGKWIAYVSDRSGREELYVSAVDGAGEPQKLTDVDALKAGYAWSPDSTQIAYTASDGKLRAVLVATKEAKEITTSRYGNVGQPAWSPDGKWLAYSKPDVSRVTDIYLAPSAGGEEKRVTFESFSEGSPRFSPDGRKLFFTRNDSTSFSQAAGLPSIQLFSVTLERLERDPDDPEERAEAEAAQAEQAPPQTPPAEGGGAAAAGAGGGVRRQTGGPRQPPKPVNIDWAGLKRRTRQLTRMPFPVTDYTVSPDGRTLAFATFELAGPANVPVIYSIQEDGKRLTRITAGSPPAAGGEGQGAGGGFGGSQVSDLNVSRDGRTLFFQEGDFVYSVPMPPPAPAGASSAMSSPSAPPAQRRRINFVAKVKIDRPSEWAEMFDDAWRTMKYRFYDAKMHGTDWDA
ncbi:MAG TPA: DPP IV N-terminal domain-containing protein, partial [Pyrinomonadaceae bacterium]|nr:DPP IV N-terminal domain-containing protein [Pyrinomonadaceae bacterium]